MAQLIDSSAACTKLSSSQAPHKLKIAAHTHHSVAAAVSGHSRLHSKLRASLGYMRPSLKTNKQKTGSILNRVKRPGEGVEWVSTVPVSGPSTVRSPACSTGGAEPTEGPSPEGCVSCVCWRAHTCLVGELLCESDLCVRVCSVYVPLHVTPEPCPLYSGEQAILPSPSHIPFHIR